MKLYCCQFVESVIRRNHLLQIPDAALRQQFLAQLTEQAAVDDPPFQLDYWRLNLQGRKEWSASRRLMADSR